MSVKLSARPVSLRTGALAVTPHAAARMVEVTMTAVPGGVGMMLHLLNALQGAFVITEASEACQTWAVGSRQMAVGS